MTVEELIQNKKTRYTEDDREWLAELAPEQLERMAPIDEPAPIVENKQDDKGDAAGQPAGDPEPHKPDELKTVLLSDLLANADPELRESIEEGQTALKDTKARLVKGIMANKSNLYAEAELLSMKVNDLRKIAALAGSAGDYGGRPPADPISNLAGGHKIEPMEIPAVNWEQ